MDFTGGNRLRKDFPMFVSGLDDHGLRTLEPFIYDQRGFSHREWQRKYLPVRRQAQKTEYDEPT